MASAEDRDAGRREPSLVAGELLAGRYRIVSFLGEGAMGEVYEADDLELGEPVAVKVLRPEIARDEQVLQRFKRETQLARKVTHPNVCRVYDLVHHSGEGDGDRRVLLTMELLRGETLADRIARQGRLTAALTAAHDAGIVHRDLKSSNVFLVSSPTGLRSVVTDFGLAWSMGPAGDGADTLTATGELVGSPAYMAPEQVRGEEATPATDVYALGVVMYEMVTGELPFVGKSAFYTALLRLQEPPPSPRTRVPDLDPAWEAVILCCLEREPADRFRRVRHVVRALGVTTAEDATTGYMPLPSRGRRRARPGLPLALLLLASGLVSAWLLTTRRDAAPAGDPEAARLYLEALQSLDGFDAPRGRDLLTRAVAIEPDNPLLHSALAAAWFDLGYHGKAEQTAKRALELSAAWSRESRRPIEARVFEVTYDWEPAIAIHQELVRGSPENLRYGLDLAEAQTEAGRAGSALETLAALRRRPRPPEDEARIDLGEALAAEARGDFARQRAAAERAGRKASAAGVRPLAAKAYLQQGWASYRLGDLTRALELTARAELLFLEAGCPTGAAEALRARGVLRFQQGDLSEAEELFAKAAALYRRSGDEGGAGETLKRHADLLDPAGEPARSESLYREVLALRIRIGDLRGTAAVLHNLARLTILRHDLSEAGRLFERALAIHRRTGHEHGEAESLQGLAQIFIRRGDLSGALRLYERALAIHRGRGDKRSVSTLLQNLAGVQLELGDLEAAERARREALALARQTGDQGGVARSLQGLADLRRLQGALAEAGSLYGRALEIYRRLNSASQEASMHHEIGVLLTLQGRPEEALRSFERALAYCRKAQARREQAAVLAHRGRALQQRGDLRAARADQEQALQLSRTAQDPRRTAEALLGLGSVQRELGELAAARRSLDEALDLFRGRNNRSGEASTLFELGRLLERRDDFDGARGHHEAAEAIRVGLGERLAAAESRLALAEVALRQGALEEAERSARSASQAFHDLGLSRRADHADALLARIPR
jgi:tetratricopeptide (TPR) repeat protein/tRNA A-37 threonylcarbamoyl transferase component Bud32